MANLPVPPSNHSQNVVSLTDRGLRKRIRELLRPPKGDERPILLFLAGPNGAGKSTLFDLLSRQSGRHDFVFVNADNMARLLDGIPAANALAATVAESAREHLLVHPTTFATETVFSDEVGSKLDYLRRAAAAGFRVVFVYIGLSSWALSGMRVDDRVENGGHGVEKSKLPRRHQASQENCRRALNFVEVGVVYDNSDFNNPFQPMAITAMGKVESQATVLPAYVQSLLPAAPDAIDEQTSVAPATTGGPPDIKEPDAPGRA